MSKPLVIVTGSHGQLGWEIMQLAAANTGMFEFLFASREELDLSKPASIPAFFQKHQPAYFINCAAYTGVDKAETEKDLAHTINTISVGVIATECKLHDCVLITISTDYVFDGNGKLPYQPASTTDPVNYYGYTKLEGERLALQNNPQTIIIRTSWVYSAHGNNFVKTMLRLMKERDGINVVDDQLGCPTYAADLAEAILAMIASLEKGKQHFGVYHYSNTGVISWFDFATAIRDEAGLACNVKAIPASAYPTPAKRPAYSVMNTDSIVNDFGIELHAWEKSLRICLDKLGFLPLKH